MSLKRKANADKTSSLTCDSFGMTFNLAVAVLHRVQKSSKCNFNSLRNLEVFHAKVNKDTNCFLGWYTNDMFSEIFLEGDC